MKESVTLSPLVLHIAMRYPQHNDIAGLLALFYRGTLALISGSPTGIMSRRI